MLDEATLEKAVEMTDEPEEPEEPLSGPPPPSMPTSLAGVPAALRAYVVRAAPRPGRSRLRSPSSRFRMTNGGSERGELTRRCVLLHQEHLKRQQERSCIPVRGLLRQLDTLNVLGLNAPGGSQAVSTAQAANNAAGLVTDVAQLRQKLKIAAERVDQIGSVL